MAKPTRKEEIAGQYPPEHIAPVEGPDVVADVNLHESLEWFSRWLLRWIIIVASGFAVGTTVAVFVLRGIIDLDKETLKRLSESIITIVDFFRH